MLNIGMLGLTLALSAAGLVQIFDQRVGTDFIGFMESQESINGIYIIRAAFGLLVFAGLLTYFYSFFVKEPAKA
jgi:nitric oxide reductase subunit B